MTCSSCSRLGGNTVTLNHKTYDIVDPSDGASSVGPDWVVWHRAVEARAARQGEPSQHWQGPDGRGCAVLPDELLDWRPGMAGATGAHREAGWRAVAVHKADCMREELLSSPTVHSWNSISNGRTPFGSVSTTPRHSLIGLACADWSAFILKFPVRKG